MKQKAVLGGSSSLNAEFLQFAFEQGVCHRKLSPEELFPSQVLTSFKV